MVDEEIKIEYDTFNSDLGWFSIQIPLTWERYDDADDEDGTYAFLNPTHWTGNLRITPLKWTLTTNQNKAEELIDNELIDSKNAIRSKIGMFDCASFKEYKSQDNDELVIYYWMFGAGNIFFTCSFCIDIDMESTHEHKMELKKVERILESIKLK